jgi:hypothetical protein
MKWLRVFMLVAALALVGAFPRPSAACPMCGEISEKAAGSDDDPMRESRAYAESIYLFLGMPFLLLGTFGFVIHREMRKRARD